MEITVPVTEDMSPVTAVIHLAPVDLALVTSITVPTMAAMALPMVVTTLAVTTITALAMAVMVPPMVA
jgi:hypothetical protein